MKSFSCRPNNIKVSFNFFHGCGRWETTTFVGFCQDAVASVATSGFWQTAIVEIQRSLMAPTAFCSKNIPSVRVFWIMCVLLEIKIVSTVASK